MKKKNEENISEVDVQTIFNEDSIEDLNDSDTIIENIEESEKEVESDEHENN